MHNQLRVLYSVIRHTQIQAGKDQNLLFCELSVGSIINQLYCFDATLVQQVLGKSDTTLVEKIKKALPKLFPITIAKDRTIMEWVNDQGCKLPSLVSISFCCCMICYTY